MSDQQGPPRLGFLAGGGETGAMMRAADWSVSPLGDPHGWPQSLRTAVSLMLRSQQPVYIAWGPALTSLYNDHYIPILGSKHPSGLGQPYALLWAELWVDFRPVVEATLNGESQWFDDQPLALAGRDTQISWFSFSYTPLLDESDRIVGLFCAAVETTTKVLNARRITAERAQLAQLFEQAPTFMTLLRGPEHVFEMVNPAYMKLVGDRPIIGKTVQQALPEAAAQGYIDLLDKVYANGEAFVASGSRIDMQPQPGGPIHERFIDFVYQPIKDGGEVTGIFVLGVDVSERTAAERALREVTAEKAQAAAMAEVADTLRQSQKMEAVGQLTGGLAHDFNNLLAGISGSIELLRLRVSQGRLGDLDRYVNAAQASLKRAASLTHRLLAFSRRQTLDPKPTDVNRLVTGMEELVRRTVGPSIELDVILEPGLWTAFVDPPQLENALLNLCINARDAMPEGGRLCMQTTNHWFDEQLGREHALDSGPYLSLCVIDSGTGMAPDVSERAFEPFFTTKPIGMGTGLGLSMVYGFARQSNGHVRIDSALGHGTTICLYLPRHEGVAMADDPAPDRVREQGDTGKLVLVVDDEPTVRMLVAETMVELGYAILEAEDGPSAMKLLEGQARIDLLVTDVGLPGGINGRQLADGARVTRPELKVLFITGYAENAVVGSGGLGPGMGVLTKPFSLSALAEKVREVDG